MNELEITKVQQGFAYARNGYIIKGAGSTIYRTYDEAHIAAVALSKHISVSAAPQRDRTATRVANLVGLAAPKATGHCHYCGLPLTNGYCEECV